MSKTLQTIKYPADHQITLDTTKQPCRSPKNPAEHLNTLQTTKQPADHQTALQTTKHRLSPQTHNRI
jgi:hypothetical protein